METCNADLAGMEKEKAMAEQGIETDCKFPAVRKTYWRSATWNSRSAPTSPKAGYPSTASSEEKGDRPSCLERQASKARTSLPPLQPLSIARRSLQEWPQAAMDDIEMLDSTTPATPRRRHVKAGPDMKLDLASVHSVHLQPTDIQLKRDKFAFFDKECSRVADYHIYLGSDAVAKNRDKLRAHGITHVLNCVGFVCPEYFKKDFIYKTLWLQDSPGEDITSLLYDVFDYFEEVGEQGGRVFVHCCQGVSRSTSLVIAYMMWRERRSFEDAFQDVKASRGITNPNMGFACQLLQCQKRVHAAPMSPNSVLRMYRLAPHSPYDPLHLVPKAVDNPGIASLDSRGAFVIHMPLAIYVWIGRDSDPKIAQAARVAAGQVVRYERAESPVHIVAEGLENEQFWESFSKYAELVDDVDARSLAGAGVKSPEFMEQRKRAGLAQIDRLRELSAGNRMVPAYSADFELYQRARQGGVVPPVPSTGVDMSSVPTRIPEREDGWSVLRRKFLSGELIPGKEMAPVDALDMNSLSPNPSLASSSPVFSPFSIASSSGTTTSSSSGTGSDSVSASPLSQLSILSPSPSLFDSPDLIQAGSSSELGPLSHSDDCQGSFPSNLKSLPPALGLKSPVELLAQRRAKNVSHPVKLIGIEDGPPVPRDQLPVLVMKLDGLVENSSGIANEVNDLYTGDSGSKANVSDGHVFVEGSEHLDTSVDSQAEAVEEAGSFPVSDSQMTASCSSWKLIAEAGNPVLYAWPHLERADILKADYLSSKSVFVLVAPQQTWSGRKNVVYIWVGKDVGNGNDASWLSTGKQFLRQMECRTGAHIRVAREGQEPEEFWENFIP